MQAEQSDIQNIYLNLDSIAGNILSNKLSVEQLIQTENRLKNLDNDLSKLHDVIARMNKSIYNRLKTQCKHNYVKDRFSSNSAESHYTCSICGI